MDFKSEFYSKVFGFLLSITSKRVISFPRDNSNYSLGLILYKELWIFPRSIYANILTMEFGTFINLYE